MWKIGQYCEPEPREKYTAPAVAPVASTAAANDATEPHPRIARLPGGTGKSIDAEAVAVLSVPNRTKATPFVALKITQLSPDPSSAAFADVVLAATVAVPAQTNFSAAIGLA